jgi:hypothetical protein
MQLNKKIFDHFPIMMLSPQTALLILHIPCVLILVWPFLIWLLLSRFYRKHPFEMMRIALRNTYWKDTYTGSKDDWKVRSSKPKKKKKKKNKKKCNNH